MQNSEKENNIKKVLVFGITDKKGGVESVIMNYYRNIDRDKIQFDFLCNTEIVAYEDEINSLGGKIYRISARKNGLMQYKKDMKKFFKEHAKEYSSIWVNISSLANIDYLKYAKKYGISKRIIHSHNSQNMDSFLRGLLHKWNKLFIKYYATDFWSCSKEASTWFYSKKIIESDKYKLINNAIDIEKFRFNEETRERIRKELNIPMESLVIGNVGRFHFQKNHPFIINVFNEISKKDENARLILVGIGEDEEKIKEMVAELKLKDKVLFLGQVNNVNEIMQAMDVLLFPSKFEGLSVTLVEAQASGIPIVCSKNCSSDSKMSDNFYQLSLEESYDNWADFILKVDKENKNNENIELLRKKGFDIKNEAEKLQKILV